jgi:SAM-dependent methyltransferase
MKFSYYPSCFSIGYFTQLKREEVYVKMETKLTSEDRKRINQGLCGKYAKVSVNPEGLFRYPTGRAGLEALNYDPRIVSTLPEAAVASYCGVGNPFTLGPIHGGETVLDIGCGCGVDTLIAAIMVGSEGKAVGIDLIPEMLSRAKENLSETMLKNVVFQEGSGEDLPFPDEKFDVVISNGVFNLIPDKAKALAEGFRVFEASRSYHDRRSGPCR